MPEQQSSGVFMVVSMALAGVVAIGAGMLMRTREAATPLRGVTYAEFGDLMLLTGIVLTALVAIRLYLPLLERRLTD